MQDWTRDLLMIFKVRLRDLSVYLEAKTTVIRGMFLLAMFAQNQKTEIGNMMESYCCNSGPWWPPVSEPERKQSELCCRLPRSRCWQRCHRFFFWRPYRKNMAHTPDSWCQKAKGPQIETMILGIFYNKVAIFLFLCRIYWQIVWQLFISTGCI